MRLLVPSVFAALLALPVAATAQQTATRPAARAAQAAPTSPLSIDTAAFASLRWREVGPARGGRSVAVGGSVARPNEYWMGTTGGGVWKTTDGGLTWQPMSDRFFGGTIGAIAVDPRNPDVVWVGGGETCIRGNTAHGDGLWKTTDGGRTWALMGLKETRHIARVRVHPTNPDIVYVGALGHAFGNNPERGVFKTTDGGKTWAKILYRNDSTGISDLIMDPNDPNTLYAAFWHAYRRPWMLNSGGPGGGLFKTTDGGATWREIT
ncbi:MAG TPA: glycosyl hydrolase, partial [Gemmatimonadaceae bacterium]|nr:glycosyl hydrolase [Gemmatimonadaceae bacterium]